MDEKLKKSGTWPYVAVFALGMEEQLERHRHRGDRPGWMAAKPEDLLQAALEQADKASDAMIRLLLTPPTATPEAKAELLKRLIHTANFLMMVADASGVLPEPNPEYGLRTVAYAQRGAAMVGELGVAAGMVVLDEVRLTIGANEGENIENALIRYTAAVRLGCALALEQHAQHIRKNPPDGTFSGKEVEKIAAALIGGAAFLRQNLPEYSGEQNAEQVTDAISRWKAEQLDLLKAGILESVFPKFWQEALGDVPSDAAKEKLRQLLEDFQPLDMNAPLPLGPEGERIRAELQAQRDVDDLNRREQECLAIERGPAWARR